YITEEIWRYLPGERKPLILATWPTADAHFADEQAENDMNLLADLVIQIRNVRNEYEVDPGRRIHIIAQGGAHSKLIQDHAYIFSRQCNVERVDMLDGQATPEQSAAVVSGDVTIYLPLAGLVDLEAERKRLEGELEAAKSAVAKGE